MTKLIPVALQFPQRCSKTQDAALDVSTKSQVFVFKLQYGNNFNFTAVNLDILNSSVHLVVWFFFNPELLLVQTFRFTLSNSRHIRSGSRCSQESYFHTGVGRCRTNISVHSCLLSRRQKTHGRSDVGDNQGLIFFLFFFFFLSLLHIHSAPWCILHCEVLVGEHKKISDIKATLQYLMKTGLKIIGIQVGWDVVGFFFKGPIVNAFSDVYFNARLQWRRLA